MYPNLAASFFDEKFLKSQNVRSEIEKLLTPNLVPDAKAIEKVWHNQFKFQSKGIHNEIEYFLTTLAENIQSEQALKTFVDSRNLSQLVQNTTDIIEQLGQLNDIITADYSQSSDITIDVYRQNYNYFELETGISGELTPSKITYLPAELGPDCFVGYDNILQQICTSGANHHFAILGITGSGKTSVLSKVSELLKGEAIFRYEFRTGLISIEDILYRLTSFIDEILLDNGKMRQTMYSPKVPDAIKIDFILSLLNQIDCWLLFDSIELVKESNERVSSFLKTLITSSTRNKVIYASQVEPIFLSERDYILNNIQKITLSGLKDQEIQRFFECRGIKLTEEQITLVSNYDGVMPIILEFLVPLLTDDKISNEIIEQALKTSKDKLADELFEHIYAKLNSDEKIILSILGLFVFPTDKNIIKECVTLLTSKSKFRPTMLQLKKKLLLSEYADDYVFVHDTVRQLVSAFSEEIDEYRLVVAEHLSSTQVTTFEEAFEIFQMYYTAQHFDEAAQLLTNNTLNFIPYYVEPVQTLLLGFAQDMVTIETWIWLLGTKGDVACHLRQYNLAEQHFRNMITLAEQENNTHALSSALLSLGNVFYYQNNHEALNFYQRSLQICENSNDEYGKARVLNNIALIYIDQGKYVDAQETLETTLALLRKLEMPKWRLVNALGNIGNLHYKQGNWDEADKYAQEVLQMARDVGNPLQEALTIYNLGLHQVKRGKQTAARKLFGIALNIGEKFKSWQTLEMALNALFELELQDKNYEAGIEILEQLLEIYNELDFTIEIAETKFKIGSVYLMNGEYEQGLVSYSEALDKIELLSNGLIDVQISNLTSFALVYEYTDVLMQILKKQKNRLCKLEVSFALARIYGGLGEIYLNVKSNQRIGIACLIKEIEILEALNSSHEQIERLIDIGNHHLNSGNPAEAETFYASGLILARKTGNIHLIEGSILSLAHAKLQLGTLKEIQSDFQEILNRAGDLEHYDNLVQMLSFAGKANISEIESDVRDAARIFQQALYLSIIQSYKHFLDKDQIFTSTFEIIRDICEVIDNQLMQGNVERAKQFYRELLIHITDVPDLEEYADWLSHYLEPIADYLAKLPQESAWEFAVEVWSSKSNQDYLE